MKLIDKVEALMEMVDGVTMYRVTADTGFNFGYHAKLREEGQDNRSYESLVALQRFFSEKLGRPVNLLAEWPDGVPAFDAQKELKEEKTEDYI